MVLCSNAVNVFFHAIQIVVLNVALSGMYVVSSLFGGQVTAAVVIKARKVDSPVPKNGRHQHHPASDKGVGDMPLAATVKSQMLRLLRRSKSSRGATPVRGSRKDARKALEAKTNKRFSLGVDPVPTSGKGVLTAGARGDSKHMETRIRSGGWRHSSPTVQRRKRPQVAYVMYRQALCQIHT